MVVQFKSGLKTEGCWVRIAGLSDNFIIGILLNEPEQNFGYHKGEKIGFFVYEMDDKEIICYSDMNSNSKTSAD